MERSNARLWLGIILIVIGFLLVTDNLGLSYFNFRHLIFSWHTIFIIIGIILLAKSKDSTAGIIFLVIGLFGTISHLLNPFFVFTFRDFWPLIIIIIGLFFILKKNGKKNVDSCEQLINEENSTDNVSTNDFIDETYILTNCHKKVESKNFSGGRITIIAASVNIDLKCSTLAAGEHTLEITCLGGGCSISIPRNWKVITSVSTIFGGFDTKQYIIDNSMPLNEGLLIVKGIILFGGGEIKSV